MTLERAKGGQHYPFSAEMPYSHCSEKVFRRILDTCISAETRCGSGLSVLIARLTHTKYKYSEAIDTLIGNYLLV